jgi:hypothetical protein
VEAAEEPLLAEEVVEAAEEPSPDAEREEVVVAGKPSVDRKRMRKTGNLEGLDKKEMKLDMTLFRIVFYISMFSMLIC